MFGVKQIMEAIIDEIIFLEELQNTFSEYTFVPLEWEKSKNNTFRKKIFVVYDDVQLGRIDLKKSNGECSIFSSRTYKPYDYDFEIEDSFFYQFNHWVVTRERKEIPDSLIIEAKTIANNKLEEKLQWRRENPRYNRKGKKISRKKLTVSWMQEFRTLLHKYMEQ